MKNLLSILLVVCFFSVSKGYGQSTKVLFIGNSYTAVNNLPALVRSVALSNGDSLIVDSYTPGGYTFEGHSTDPNTIAKIYSDQWDFVILQEQSQRPSFPPAQVAIEVYPYAMVLDSLIHDNNPCSETVFYMTWGRKNGDASNCAGWPPVCTYEGMQARLRESYMEMGLQNNATVGPVGAVWRYMRSQNPVFDLYQPDESHPSLHGSYLAACTLYSTMFHKRVIGTVYNAGLPVADANTIQNSVDAVVSDSLFTWYEHGNIPVAGFAIISCTALTVTIANQSLNANNYLWDYGDGTTMTGVSVVHSYASFGPFSTTLYADNGCKSDSVTHPTMPCVISGVGYDLECNNIFSYDGLVQIECLQQVESVGVFDVRGREVPVEGLRYTERGVEFRVDEVVRGIYFVRVMGERGVRVRKVVLGN